MRLATVSLMGGQPWGGSEVLWHALALHALQQGDQVLASVYAWEQEHEKIAALKKAGADIFYRKRFNADAGLAEKVFRFIKKRRPALNKDYQSIIDFKPDHVFISQGDNFDFALHHRPLYELLKKYHIRYSFVCHSHAQYGAIPPKEIYADGKEVFTNATAVYFVSHKQQQLTERKLMTTLKNACQTFNPLALEIPDAPLLWPNENPVQFAAVGAITGGKGQDTLLEVFSQPQWKERNWNLNIYGGGDGTEYLHQLARFYDIADKVIFHGHVENIKAVWEHNHLLIIPSAAEGLPISLLEAMVCGRPCITTDVGGIDELMEEGVTGFIAPAPSVKHLSAAMERAWNKKDTWEALGQQAFNLMKSRLSPHPEIIIYNKLATGS